ncbi:MAG: hypothetical protein QM808_13215 [Steroidobacteraceae bacterium]
MYVAILNNKFLTFVIAIGLMTVLSIGLRKRSSAVRAMLFSQAPAFAVAFYVLALLVSDYANVWDLIACGLFELLILCIYLRLFVNLIDCASALNPHAVTRMLYVSTAMQVITIWPLLTSVGFGIFSEGSRVAYLYDSSLAKYLTYTQVITGAVQAGLLASRINSQNGIGLLGLAVVLINFGSSLASGSKGAVFLWLAAILSLVSFKVLKARPVWLTLSLLICVSGLVVTAYFVGSVLGLTMAEFAELALSRFFLVNDARALAVDLRGFTNGVDFFSEAFRSLGNMLSLSPQNQNLGSFLYDTYFGPSGGSGANASLTALITAYSQPGMAFLPALLFSCILAFSAIAIRDIRRNMQVVSDKYIVTIMSMNLLLLFSQDFLAFQVALPLSFVIAPILMFSGRGFVRESRNAIA